MMIMLPTTPALPATPTPTSPVLRVGASGTDVQVLQRLLVARGLLTSADGAYGPLTKAAVVAYQRANGLTPDGVVGPLTWASLRTATPTAPTPATTVPRPATTTAGSISRLGSTGPEVALIQKRLAAHGQPVRVTSVFDVNTRNAVVSFQRARALTADGIVGPRTRAALLGPTSPAPTAITTVPTGINGAIQFALSKIGAPYVWGGESDTEGGYDCSGLVWASFHAAGLPMTRTTAAGLQSTYTPITRSQLRPGDLVFIGHPAYHVMLVSSPGMVVEAPRAGVPVRQRPIPVHAPAYSYARVIS